MRAACVGLCDADSDESKQVAWVGVSIYFERFHSPRIFEFLLKKGKKKVKILKSPKYVTSIGGGKIISRSLRDFREAKK